MGLAEKKVIRNLEENTIPDFLTKLKELSGKDIELDMNWASFQTEKQLLEVEYQVLGRICEGLQIIAQDDLGKEAINETINKIVVNNINDASAKNISISDSVLTIDGNWEDFSSGIFTSDDYAKKIEEEL